MPLAAGLAGCSRSIAISVTPQHVIPDFKIVIVVVVHGGAPWVGGGIIPTFHKPEQREITCQSIRFYLTETSVKRHTTDNRVSERLEVFCRNFAAAESKTKMSSEWL